MTRKTHQPNSSGRTILLVDDNPDYLEATRRLLEREGHRVLAVPGGASALSLLRHEAVDLLLLDYFMPAMTGEEVVAELRHFNPHVQVILQTGYATERPPRELLQRLDIQGYVDKSEGPEKLLLWVDVGLKAAYAMQLLHKSRQGLRYILDATPSLHKLQPLGDLLQGILWQVSGLLGAVNTFLAVRPEEDSLASSGSAFENSLLVMIEEDMELVIRASTGRFESLDQKELTVANDARETIREVLGRGEIAVQGDMTVVPLRVGDLTLGVIYLDRPVAETRDIELLQVFANQAAVAIQNAQLYEMATLDPLTGVYVRRFFEQWLLRDLRAAFRGRQPVSLLMVDVDGLKQINDSVGHVVGDRLLAMVGKVLRQVTRGSDIVGRYGGDEFVILLPQTRAEDAQRLGDRILNALGDKRVGEDQGVPVRGSIGLSALEPHRFADGEIPRPLPAGYFQEVGSMLVQWADEALYRAKRAGGERVCRGVEADWLALRSNGSAPAKDAG